MLTRRRQQCHERMHYCRTHTQPLCRLSARITRVASVGVCILAPSRAAAQREPAEACADARPYKVPGLTRLRFGCYKTLPTRVGEGRRGLAGARGVRRAARASAGPRVSTGGQRRAASPWGFDRGWKSRWRFDGGCQGRRHGSLFSHSVGPPSLLVVRPTRTGRLCARCLARVAPQADGDHRRRRDARARS